MNAEQCGLITSELRRLELKKYLWHKCGDMWSMKSFISRPLRGTRWHNDWVRPAAAGMCRKSQIGDIWRWQNEELCYTEHSAIILFMYDNVSHEHHGGCSYRMILTFILVFNWTAVVSYNRSNTRGIFLALQKDQESRKRNSSCFSDVAVKENFCANIKRVPWCVNRHRRQKQ